MSYSEKAATFQPPVAGKTVYVLDASDFGSSTDIAIPDSWAKAIVTFHADGGSFAVAFGEENVSADETAKTTVSSNAISTTATGACAVVNDGEKLHVNMEMLKVKGANAVTHFAVHSVDDAGYLRIHRSTGALLDAS